MNKVLMWVLIILFCPWPILLIGGVGGFVLTVIVGCILVLSYLVKNPLAHSLFCSISFSIGAILYFVLFFELVLTPSFYYPSFPEDLLLFLSHILVGILLCIAALWYIKKFNNIKGTQNKTQDVEVKTKIIQKKTDYLNSGRSMDSVSASTAQVGSLIKCDECGKQVSSRAAACPSCGNPINKNISNNRFSRV